VNYFSQSLVSKRVRGAGEERKEIGEKEGRGGGEEKTL